MPKSLIKTILQSLAKAAQYRNSPAHWPKLSRSKLSHPAVRNSSRPTAIQLFLLFSRTHGTTGRYLRRTAHIFQPIFQLLTSVIRQCSHYLPMKYCKCRKYSAMEDLLTEGFGLGGCLCVCGSRIQN